MSSYTHQTGLKIKRYQTVKHNKKFGSNLIPEDTIHYSSPKFGPAKYPVWFQQLLKPARGNHMHTWYAENIYPDPEY